MFDKFWRDAASDQGLHCLVLIQWFLGKKKRLAIDHEIHVFSTVILSLPLIQEGQLSVPGERMCTILINRLED